MVIGLITIENNAIWKVTLRFPPYLNWKDGNPSYIISIKLLALPFRGVHVFFYKELRSGAGRQFLNFSDYFTTKSSLHTS